MRQSGISRIAKRSLDVVVAGAGLCLTAPILGLTAALIRATMGSPVLFSQRRGGRDCHPFRLVKFRTMMDAVDSTGRPLSDEQRLTAVGRFLRSWSIDELPQLWNILRGEMSLVGPRPLMFHYMPRYSARQKRRHEVLPGLTGWAQINGRNSVSWEEKLELDVWYVEHWSPLLDLVILLRTCRRLLDRHGVAAEGHVTMPEFQGSGEPDEAG